MSKVLIMKDPYTCSFCGYRVNDESDGVIIVVARDGRTAICSDCVGIIADLIIEKAEQDGMIPKEADDD